MQRIQTTYTKRSSTRHGPDGHLLGGRYKSTILQDQHGPFLRQFVAPVVGFHHQPAKGNRRTNRRTNH